jgi:predicted GNAT superfamily acetyltransferase
LSAEQSSAFRIQKLNTFADFDRCVQMQDTVWGYEPSDAMSQKVFLLATQIGGQVLGAFEGDEFVGYAMALPGVRNGHAYLHSHHLAVLPAWRNQGVGRRLKLAQRDDALSRGIELMEWTFDPLEIRNAHLNIARLGAVVRRYRRNFYGASSSPLQGGLPSDRVVAEWWLRSRRVEETLAGKQPAFKVEEQVQVPAQIYEWKASPHYRETARELQAGNAAALESAFDAGCTVLGYQRTPQGDGTFQLGKWNEALEY